MVDDARAQRVLVALRGGDDRLRRLAHQVGEEALGVGGVLAGLQHRGRGDVDEHARVARGEVVECRVRVVRADLVALAVPVVVVDQAGLDGALVDSRRDQLVVLEHLRVLLDGLQPRQRGGVSAHLGDGRDQRLEVGLTGSDREAPLPVGRGEVHQRLGEVRLLELARVVVEHRCTRRDRDPVPRRRAACARDRGQGGRRHRGEEALLRQHLQGRRVLREEDVGRRL